MDFLPHEAKKVQVEGAKLTSWMPVRPCLHASRYRQGGPKPKFHVNARWTEIIQNGRLSCVVHVIYFFVLNAYTAQLPTTNPNWTSPVTKIYVNTSRFSDRFVFRPVWKIHVNKVLESYHKSMVLSISILGSKWYFISIDPTNSPHYSAHQCQWPVEWV